MDFEPTEEQQLIRESVRDWVRREAPPDRMARLRHDGSWFDPALYRSAAELGWLGMLVPEELGGSGLGLGSCAAAFEELGRAPLAGPIFTSGVLATLLLLEGGSPAQQRALLPAMIRGERVVALAALGSGLGWGPELVEGAARSDGDGFRLDGVKPYVHDAAPATAFVFAGRLGGAPGDGITLFMVERDAPGVSVQALPGLPMGIGKVTFEGVRVAVDSVLGGPGDGWAIVERAAGRAIPLLCAFMVGACQEIFEFTLEYTRQRSAFGQLIGRFQRVQDHVVDLANQMDGARWMTAELLGTLESGLPAGAAVHETMAVTAEAYYQVCNFSHMVHAGPGTDLDHPLMGHTIASRALYQLLGGPDHHRRRMMDLRFPPVAGT